MGQSGLVNHRHARIRTSPQSEQPRGYCSEEVRRMTDSM